MGRQWVTLAELVSSDFKIKRNHKSLYCIDQSLWAYLYDVVAYILNRLDKNNQILHLSFILTREIQIKIGRDHGDIYLF